MDKYITSFCDEFGEPEKVNPPDNEYVESYRGILPEALLEYWKRFGFCAFMDGLFWIVDPKDYAEMLENWIERSPLSGTKENLYVIARSGYGDLYLWGEKSGCRYEINAMNGWIIKSDDQEQDQEKELQLFFASKSPYSIDIEDEDSDEEMFEPAVEKFGPLAEDEIFGFVPALVAGGNMLFENLQKVNMAVHLDLILQLKDPQLVGPDDLANMAFS
ncbi:GAD-like domain-containing protein [Marinobacter sp.]|uniref:GAD-like domain-containing protein n=1 Tax=Marinobacter sp. TaxID=50741 RepID=UPI003A8DECD4